MRIVIPVLMIVVFLIMGGCLENAPQKQEVSHVLGNCNGIQYEYNNQSCCMGKVYDGPFGECGGTCFNGTKLKCCNNKIVQIDTKCCGDVVQPDGSFRRSYVDRKECSGSPDSIIVFCKETRSDPSSGCTEVKVGWHYEVLTSNPLK
jgi:hypothetical protein